VADLGIPPCRADAVRRLLLPDALQCWFQAQHGRWRLMDHGQHLEALVVDVAADDLRDAEEIARRFVDSEGRIYSEILVYAHLEPVAPEARVRRVRWTRGAGKYESIEYGG
jgi:hypothetical protein